MIELQDVKRLRFELGDTLVLRVNSPGPTISTAELRGLQAQLEEAFPDHRTVVLVGDHELEVVSAPPVSEASS